MNPQRKMTVQLIGFILIVLAILFAITGKRVMPVPGDVRHAAARDVASCGACHAPGGAAPLKPGHPPKEQCLICHKLSKELKP